MRVKPRLRRVHYAIWILRLFLIFGSIGLFGAIVMRVPDLQPKASPFGFVGAVGHLFIALFMNYVGFLMGREIAIRLGWLSVSEASRYHHRMYRWPDCWLEPHPGVNQRHPLDLTDGEPCRAPEHSAKRILKSRSSARAR